ncbi:PfkB family carbohydrate kinase [Paracoccus binzhouensis]|uniref:PfkB family carbohydrate kinase n=1 Tax=Paracoccus binzhouensis TaxID=2796149 RepID=UPI0018EED17C|nr:PfkB family carbohydrate kinase [Paracoccus binzhouensis]
MTETPRILCLGAMLWDMIGHSARRLDPGCDVPGRITRQPGGVALNVALALARHGLRPGILSAVGRDAPGEALIAEAQRHGVETRWLRREGGLPTDSYLAIESPEGLVAAIADARGLEAAGSAILAPLRDGRLGDGARPWQGTLVIDGNLTAGVLAGMSRDPCLFGAALRIVPASPEKAARLRPLLTHPRATFHLNRAEAEALAGRGFASAAEAAEAVTALGATAAAALAGRGFASAAEAAEAVTALGAHRVLVTDGARLVADAARNAPTLDAVPPPVAAIRVTGAGDSFLAAHLATEIAGATRAEALACALRAASSHISGKDLP